MSEDPCIAEPMNGHPAAGGLVPAGTVPSRRCSATSSRTGEPCKRWAIVGGNVCPTHGGSAPQVKEAARRRLEELAPLAVQTLGELLEGEARDPETGEAVNVPAAVRARAAADILDRVGIDSPEEFVVVDGTPRPDLDDAIAQALARRGMHSGPAQESG